MSIADGVHTAESLYTTPDDGRRYELRGGVLVSEPMPGFRHGYIAARIAELLNRHVRPGRLGAVVAETGFILARDPDTVRGPDIAFVAAERIDSRADLVRAWDGPPDLAIEILSPSNTPDAMHAKVADYLAAGTRLVWVVDPERRSVTAYRSLLHPVLLSEHDRLEGGEAVPGFSVAVAELFED